MAISRQRKIIGATLAAATAIFIIYQSNTEKPLSSPPQHLAQSVSADNPTSTVTPAQSAPATSSATEPTPNKSLADKQVHAAWHLDDTGATPHFPLPEGIVVYEAITLDMDNPAYPQPGDAITLPLPEDLSVQVKVDSAHLNPNGDYSWRGYVDGHGNEYPVVMTYGHRSVFATVTTPRGIYALESINGSGWIYKNPSNFELSHPGVDDALEIPHPADKNLHHHHH